LLEQKALHIVGIRRTGGHRRCYHHVGVLCSELFISVGAVMVVNFWVCL